MYVSGAHPEKHNATLKEKKVFAWTMAQLEFLAEQIIKLKAKKMPRLNAVLAQLLDRSEKAIQKIRTKTEYKPYELNKGWMKVKSENVKQHQEK